MLIKSTDDLKKFLSVDRSTHVNSFLPKVKESEERFIKRVLGKDLYNALDTAYNGNTPLSGDMLALWSAVNMANASMAYYLYLPILNARLGENLVGHTSEETERVTKWQFDELRQQLLTSAYNALDSLYLFLESSTDASWYDLWAASDAFSEYKSYLVPRADIMSEHTPLNGSRYLYTRFLSNMSTVESLNIRKKLGDDYYLDLKNKYKNDELADEDKNILPDIQKAISLYTYAKALQSPLFRQEIIVITNVRIDGVPAIGANHADTNNALAYGIEATRYQSEADQIMDMVVATLNKLASTEVYPVYFNSTSYKDPSQTYYKSSNRPESGTFSMI